MEKENKKTLFAVEIDCKVRLANGGECYREGVKPYIILYAEGETPEEAHNKIGKSLQQVVDKYREPHTYPNDKKVCPHDKMLNRGCPPNLSNQRVCDGCGTTFNPPAKVGGTIYSNESFDIIRTWAIDR